MRNDFALAHARDNTAFYRRGDQRGTLQEVTPRTTRVEFVYIVTPQLAAGATAGNTPPCALGQPR